MPDPVHELETEDLATLDEVAAPLGISVKTLRRRLAEAGIRGPRPGRRMLLSKSDCKALLAFLRTREPAPRPRKRRNGGPRPDRRGRHHRQTARLLDGICQERPVVALDLERPAKPS